MSWWRALESFQRVPRDRHHARPPCVHLIPLGRHRLPTLAGPSTTETTCAATATQSTHPAPPPPTPRRQHQVHHGSAPAPRRILAATPAPRTPRGHCQVRRHPSLQAPSRTPSPSPSTSTLTTPLLPQHPDACQAPPPRAPTFQILPGRGSSVPLVPLASSQLNPQRTPETRLSVPRTGRFCLWGSGIPRPCPLPTPPLTLLLSLTTSQRSTAQPVSPAGVLSHRRGFRLPRTGAHCPCLPPAAPYRLQAPPPHHPPTTPRTLWSSLARPAPRTRFPRPCPPPPPRLRPLVPTPTLDLTRRHPCRPRGLAARSPCLSGPFPQAPHLLRARGAPLAHPGLLLTPPTARLTAVPSSWGHLALCPDPRGGPPTGTDASIPHRLPPPHAHAQHPGRARGGTSRAHGAHPYAHGGALAQGRTAPSKSSVGPAAASCRSSARPSPLPRPEPVPGQILSSAG